MHQRKQVWAHLRLVHDSENLKICNVEVLDESGLILIAHGVHYSNLFEKLKVFEKPTMCTLDWVETQNINGGDIEGDSKHLLDDLSGDVCVINIPGCSTLDTLLVQVENLNEKTQCTTNISSMKFSEVEALLNANDIPKYILVPLVDLECKDPSSSFVLEGCISLLQVLLKKLNNATDGITRCIGFWTRNAEVPQKLLGMKDEDDVKIDDIDEVLSLVGGSVWGMVRSAVLEINPNILSIVCIDSDCDFLSPFNLNEVLMIGSHNSSSEVCFRSSHRFERRLCLSKTQNVVMRDNDRIGVALISGGPGGLGLVTAEALLELGADHVILVSRSGKVKDYDGQMLEQRLDRLKKFRKLCPIYI